MREIIRYLRELIQKDEPQHQEPEVREEEFREEDFSNLDNIDGKITLLWDSNSGDFNVIAHIPEENKTKECSDIISFLLHYLQSGDLEEYIVAALKGACIENDEFFNSVIAKWHALKLLDGDMKSEEPLIQPYDVFNTQR
jgi:hypothetical protein